MDSPPTQAALIQHTTQMMVAAPELPSPGDWGWNRNDTGGWDVCWTTLPEATKACRVNSSTVDAGKDVEDSANVSRQHCCALPFATAVVYAAHTTNISIR